MHLPCENSNSPCPVILPASCPHPRCDCQEDHSRRHHCRLCHLPFDIENRLRPDSGLRTFCSCFLGESRVLVRYTPAVFFMPVFCFLPPRGNIGVDSGRSSSSSLSTESNHTLPPAVDVCLDETSNSSRKSGDHYSPNNAIMDSSVEFDNSLPNDCFDHSTESSHSSVKNSVLDTLGESNCYLLPKGNSAAKNSDRNSLSEEVTQFDKDSNSLKMKGDCENSGKGIFTELKNVSRADSLGTRGTLGSISSHSENNRSCKNENLNATAPVFSEVNNLEKAREIFCPSFNDNPELVDRTLLAQDPTDQGTESTSYTNVTEPFTTTEDKTFSIPEKFNCLSRDPIMDYLSDKQKPLCVITNDTNLNSSESNTSCLMNRFQMTTSAEPSHQSLAPLNDSYFKNNEESAYKYTQSRDPSDTLNVSASNTNHLNSFEPRHQDLAPLNSMMEGNYNRSNISNYEDLRVGINPLVAQENLQYPSVETLMRYGTRFEASSQQRAVNVSSRNELVDTFQVCSVQPNRATSSYQQHWSAENSPAPPGFNPRGNLPSTNAGAGPHGSGMDFRTELRAENRSGLVGGSDLIQEIMRMNANRGNNSLTELMRNTKHS